MREVVSSGTLRAVLLEHAESPRSSGLRYFQLGDVIDPATYKSLTKEQRAWFEPDHESAVIVSIPRLGDPEPPGTKRGFYALYKRRPEQPIDAWVVERA